MGAGIQRWWRSYEQECAEWDRAQEPKAREVVLDDGVRVRIEHRVRRHDSFKLDMK